MVPEAPLTDDGAGLVPAGPGWFVLNAREARWRDHPDDVATCVFEDENARFEQLGINLNVLEPGQPLSMYHYEVDQEDFLVLAGEALLIVEGEERPLRQWDFVHCPQRTAHVIIGAGSGPCVVLAVGARVESMGENWGAYTVAEAAIRHGAGVEEETSSQAVAYAAWPKRELTRYREGWLPDL